MLVDIFGDQKWKKYSPVTTGHLTIFSMNKILTFLNLVMFLSTCNFMNWYVFPKGESPGAKAKYRLLGNFGKQKIIVYIFSPLDVVICPATYGILFTSEKKSGSWRWGSQNLSTPSLESSTMVEQGG